MQDHNRKLARVAALVLSLALLLTVSGCARNRRRLTPTPTKTPKVAAATAPATSTPVPPTPTTQPTNTATAIPPTPTQPAPPTEAATDTPEPPAPDAETPEPADNPVVINRPENQNPFTGLQVADPAVLKRRPLFVVVNNDKIARDVHYGLAEAELVFEYLMEGRAVTRFTAVYLAAESAQIGPVRSARLINYYLTPQYSGGLVASGAGQDVRWWLKHKMEAPYLDIDLDDPGNSVYSFSLGTDYRTRLQTSTAKLRQWLINWDVQRDPQLSGFAFSDDAPAGSPGTSASVDFPTTVNWTYDAGSGTYLRAFGDVAHLDAATGEQLSASNVIVATMPHEATEYVEDSLGTTSIRIIPIGEGPVTILRDGVSVSGVWRAGEKEMHQFYDSSGALLPLKPGNTWIEVIEPGIAVTVQ